MRQRHIIAIASLGLLLAVATPAAAQLSDEYADWADGPVQFLMTKDDDKAWKKIDNDREAKQFIELFWARRNPNLGSTFNPFKAQFEARVRYADEHFSNDRQRGSMTDRARVLYLFGSPHQAERRAPTETVTSIEDTGGGTDEVRANVERWVYDPTRLPEGFKTRGSRVMFVFYEEKPETNIFTLDRSFQEATMALRAMARGPEVYVLHPDLEEVPKPVAVPGADAASDTALAWLDATEPLHQPEMLSQVDIGMADASHCPVWLHLELPPDAPRLDALAGRVLDPEGEVVSTFQTEVTGLPTPTGVAYHLTFPLSPGAYRLEVAGAAGNQPAIVFADDVEVPEIPDEGTWMSGVVTGLNAEMEADLPLGSAYSFGGWHLRPYIAGEIPRENELSYFGFIVRPGTDDAGEHNVKARVTLKREGQRLGAPLIVPLQLSQISDELAMYGNVINLTGLNQPGEYTLAFRIKDEITDVETRRTVTVNIAE